MGLHIHPRQFFLLPVPVKGSLVTQLFPIREPNQIQERHNVSLFFIPKQKGCSGGSDLLSPIGLSSALEYFTSVFGMGTGGTTPE